MTKTPFYAWFVALACFGCAESEPVVVVRQDVAPIAATAYGRVRGAVEDGILVFKGIRYGADTATTRFQPPVPPLPWSDVEDAQLR